MGLKVRGALITEVYRKSLAINLTTLSQYSTGQVSFAIVFPPCVLYYACVSLTYSNVYAVCVCVCMQVINFMSTDTDRIVNFCQSFHQFWSLPFQIGVSLFLLHQQVSVAT